MASRIPGVGTDERDVGRNGERLADRFGRVVHQAVERVDGDDERHAVRLEVVDRREAVVEALRVDEHDRADGPAHEVVPHEAEAVLAGGAEQVEDQVVAERDAAEVHRHGRRRLGRRSRPVSSMSSATASSRASVVSGVISEIEPTNVVFPTAKPPAMMILTGIGTSVRFGRSLRSRTSERLKAIENPFEKLDIGTVAGLRSPVVAWLSSRPSSVMSPTSTRATPSATLEMGRDLGDGHAAGAQRDDSLAFEREARLLHDSPRASTFARSSRSGGRAMRTRASAGQRVRADAAGPFSASSSRASLMRSIR